MMRIHLVIQHGPMTGHSKETDLDTLATGKLIIGREPGPGGWILEGDNTVSRRHGELFLEDGQVVFSNLSPNGTRITGGGVRDEVLMGRRILPPKTTLKLGLHELQVLYRLPAVTSNSTVPRGQGTSPWHDGPLARPAVRMLLVTYLLGMLCLTLYLGTRTADSPDRAYRQIRQEYTSHYLPSRALDEATGAQRLAHADRLVVELEAHVRSQRPELARRLCRELMTIDQDPHSPLYHFAVDRLGKLSHGR